MTEFVWPVGTSSPDDIVPVYRSDAVRMEVLRAGAKLSPLFLMPGLTGQTYELKSLAETIESPHAVIGLATKLLDAEGRPIDSIERMAQLLILAIRSIQPSGPYRLGGYSFGALVAFEIAHQLRSADESVDALILIDPVMDERYWPRHTWLRALLRRSFWQMRTIARLPPGEAFVDLGFRDKRLGKRLLRHARPDGGVAFLSQAPTEPLKVNSLNAMGRYKPFYYNGCLTVIGPKIDRHFGCQTTAQWEGLATYTDVLFVPCDHLTMVRDPASLRIIAEAIGRRLEAREPVGKGLQPVTGFERPMLLSTMRWFSTARIAHSLVGAGFTVTSCRPNGHPLALVDGIGAQYRLVSLWPLRSLREAIANAEPDIILPDDERAIRLLRRLYDEVANEDPAMAALISRSMGGASSDKLDSRAWTITEARRLGVAGPKTERIPKLEALASWQAPFVLKTDGSWGGGGVALIRQPNQIDEAWRTVSCPPSFPRAAKRLLVNRDIGAAAEWLKQQRPIVNAQAYVEGKRKAIATAACFDGRILNSVCLEVVHAAEERGSATVLQIIDNPGMAGDVERIVQRFHLSGFVGLDFLIDGEGVAHLVEINFRITPTCHLLVDGKTRGIIALFPQERIRDPQSTYKLDILEDSPALIKFATASIRKQARLTACLSKRLRNKHARWWW